MMIDDRHRIEFLCTLDGRFTIHTRVMPQHSFVWDMETADIYATGTNWCNALDAAILRWREE
jgi:hypothetical protein